MIKDTISIKTKSRSYDVSFSYDENIKDVFSAQVDYLLKKHSKVAVITDTNIENIYKDILQGLQGRDNLIILSVAPDESSKSRAKKEEIEDILLGKGLDMQSAIVAMGGGVVGDLVGFVAATYMRGIAFYQMPTSLLAMCDSSIGGKTGVNTPFGKNLIGAFYQPLEIFTNVAFLKTLPLEERINGIAEIVKFSIISDAKLFAFLKKNEESFFQLDSTFFNTIIKTTVAIKGDIVSKDERDGSIRKILNYGHTVGHALERLSDFRIKHGLAIAWGMVVETAFAVHLGHVQESDLAQIKTLIGQYKLPTNIEDLREILKDAGFSITGTELYEAMVLDKKNKDSKVYMTVLDHIGLLKTFGGTYLMAIDKNDFVNFFDKSNL